MKEISTNNYLIRVILNNLITKFLSIYFYLCFLFPLELNLLYVKLSLLLIICLLIFLYKLGSLKFLVPKFLIFYLLAFILPIFIGLGHKDFFKPFLNFFILPIIYVFIFSNSKISLASFRKIIFSALYFSVLISVLLFFGLIAGDFGSVYLLESKYSFNSELVEFSFPQMNILPFVMPFVINDLYNTRRKIIFFIVLLSLFIFIIILGRSGILFSLLIVLFFMFRKRIRNIFLFIPALVVGFFILLPVINVDLNPSALTRQIQFFELVNFWLKNPFFGNGLGSHPDYIRSETNPSSYELFYLSLLNQIGILGIVLFFIFLLSIYSFINNKKMNIIWFGILGVLVASFTNPYLDRFDFIFILFLPILFIREEANENRISY